MVENITSQCLIHQIEDGQTRLEVRLEEETVWVSQKEGGREVARNVDFYNLDMIISVGYRVKSHVATRFR